MQPASDQDSYSCSETKSNVSGGARASSAAYAFLPAYANSACQQRAGSARLRENSSVEASRYDCGGARLTKRPLAFARAERSATRRSPAAEKRLRGDDLSSLPSRSQSKPSKPPRRPARSADLSHEVSAAHHASSGTVGSG